MADVGHKNCSERICIGVCVIGEDARSGLDERCVQRCAIGIRDRDGRLVGRGGAACTDPVPESVNVLLAIGRNFQS